MSTACRHNTSPSAPAANVSEIREVCSFPAYSGCSRCTYTRHTAPPVALCCQGAAVDVPPATTRCLVYRRATCTPPRQPTAAQRLMYRKFLAPEVAEACPDQNESRFSRINANFSCGKQNFKIYLLNFNLTHFRANRFCRKKHCSSRTCEPEVRTWY